MKTLTSSELDSMNPEDQKAALQAMHEACRAGKGHNSGSVDETPDGATITMPDGEKFQLTDKQLSEAAKKLGGRARVGGVAVDQLKSIISRVERLEEEKAGLAADIRDVFAEAKGNGFDVKAIRAILKIRKLDASEREEAETILDVYKHALGMVPQFEMFEDADEQESEAASVETEEPPNDEVVYQQAVTIVIRDRKASTSYLQRMLKTGYNRAAQMIERMESEGIVGPANHVGKREVLREPEGEAA